MTLFCLLTYYIYLRKKMTRILLVAQMVQYQFLNPKVVVWSPDLVAGVRSLLQKYRSLSV